MHFFLLLECTTGAVLSVDDFSGETVGHGLFASGSGKINDPAQTQGLTSFRSNFHGNLVVGTTYTAGLNFQNGHNVFQCFGEHFQGVLTHLGFNLSERVVYNLLCNALFAVVHNIVDQLGNQLGIIKRVR